MMNGRDCTISDLEKYKNKKKVSFNLNNNSILNMRVWAFAYRKARKSDWMRITADRYRFELRKQRLEAMLIEIGFFFF